MQFAGTHQGVQHGAPLGGFMTPGEHVVFSADGNWTDGPFDGVVIDV